MARSVVEFAYEGNGKRCAFLCDFDCPVSVAKEAAFQFLKELGQIEDQEAAKVQAEKAKEEEKDGIVDSQG